MDVGIRDLRSNLSAYLERVRNGDELIVTDRGTAVARILPMATERALDRLVAQGLVTPAPRPDRGRPRRRVRPEGSVSDLVADQRR